MYKNHKVTIVVQSRLGSKRLPGKALMQICGKSLLEHLLIRVQDSEYADQIVLATSTLAENDKLEDLAHRLELNKELYVFRGSEEDVLKRYYDLSLNFPSQLYIRICADNPLTDPEIIDRCIEEIVEKNVDHVATFFEPSYPYGVGCEVFTDKALETANKTAKNPEDREHIEKALHFCEKIKSLNLKAPSDLHYPELKVTVDYLADFKKISRVFESLLPRNSKFRTRDVIEYFRDCPILLFANGELGLELVQFLKSENENIVAVVTHPDQTARKKQEILSILNLPSSAQYSFVSQKDQKVFDFVKEVSPELACSFWSSYLFSEEFIRLVPRGIINLHNSLLPMYKGSGGNFWPIVENRPAGVSLHYIEPKVDSGGLIAQAPVEYSIYDTGGSLYKKQVSAMINMFCEYWPQIRNGPVPTKPQEGPSSFHFHHEFQKMCKLNLHQNMSLFDFINLLRAFKFENKRNAYFVDPDSGDKVFVDIELHRATESEKPE